MSDEKINCDDNFNDCISLSNDDTSQQYFNNSVINEEIYCNDHVDEKFNFNMELISLPYLLKHILAEVLKNHKVFVNGNSCKTILFRNNEYNVKNTCPIDSLSELYINLFSNNMRVFDKCNQLHHEANCQNCIVDVILKYAKSNCNLD